MKVRASSSATWSALEYFFYAILLIQTAIAAFAYRVLSHAAEISTSAAADLAVLYIALLAVVFYQLNRLHRKRKRAAALPAPTRALLAAAPQPLLLPAPSPPPVIAAIVSNAALVEHHAPLVLEVTRDGGIQGSTTDLRPSRTVAPRRILGLTLPQLAIIFVVFLAGLKAFSWVLSNLKR